MAEPQTSSDPPPLPSTQPAPPPRRSARCVAAMSLGAAAAVLALVVGALLVIDRRRAEPTDAFVESPRLEAMKAELGKDPANTDLATELRELDLQRRRDYFHHLTLARWGNYVLIACFAVFLIGARTALAWGKRLRRPGGKPVEVEQEMRAARGGRWALGMLAVVLGAGAISPVAVEAYLRMTAPEPVPTHFADPNDVARYWAGFRGPGGQGVSAYTNVPTEWDANSGRNILWKTPLALPGKGSPAIWGKRVFLSGASRDRREVYCYDADSGKLLWTAAAKDIPGSPPRAKKAFGDTGYAAASPVADDRHVAAIFSNGDLACFDHEGQLVWAKALGSPINQYTHGSSLAMWRNLVIVQWDQASVEDHMSKLLAFDVQAGRAVWQKRRPVANSWTTPAVVFDDKRHQILTSANPWVISYDPNSGEELWRAKCMDGADAASSIVFANGVAYAVSAETELYAIRADGEGDVTETHVAWQAGDGLPDLTSPLTDGKHVWLLTTMGTLTCYEAAGGEKVYEHELEKSFNASPSLVGDRLYLVTVKGLTLILAAGREPKTLATNALGEAVYASPAFQDGRIYFRGAKHLFCIAEATP